MIESGGSCDDEDLIRCKWGTKCRDIRDKLHCSKYSHPSVHKHADHQIPCKWGAKCRETGNHQHCERFSHPDIESFHLEANGGSSSETESD